MAQKCLQSQHEFPQMLAQGRGVVGAEDRNRRAGKDRVREKERIATGGTQACKSGSVESCNWQNRKAFFLILTNVWWRKERNI